METPAAFQLLDLIAASFDTFQARLTLIFNQAINIAAYAAGDIEVDDGVTTAQTWQDVSVFLHPAPNTLLLNMGSIGAGAAVPQLLNAGELSGIVVAANGANWGGITDLPLPFP